VLFCFTVQANLPTAGECGSLWRDCPAPEHRENQHSHLAQAPDTKGQLAFHIRDKVGACAVSIQPDLHEMLDISLISARVRTYMPKPLTKSQITVSLAQTVGVTKKQATQALEALVALAYKSSL
jgi:hypothetical protein